MNTLVSPAMLAVWSALGALAGTLVLLAVTLWAGQFVTDRTRALWQTVRGQREAVRRAVDEASDPLNVGLARLTAIPAPVWAAFLGTFVDALADGVDVALRKLEPPEA